MALLRYLIASVCMGVIYFRLPGRQTLRFIDVCGLMGVGALGIGVYNIALNYGELSISSGMASFMVSLAPVIAALVAIIFLGEKLNFSRVMGFGISIAGVALIAIGEQSEIKWNMSFAYIGIATIAGGLYSVLQKPFLKRYNVIEATTFIIWGATLFLSIYTTRLQEDLLHASAYAILMVIYLGVFPAAVAYLAWGYVLSAMPASRAVSFLYFTPFVATLLGWIYLDEVPVLISLIGGLLAIAGVWLVNQSYQIKTS